jgi:hypothetical protein
VNLSEQPRTSKVEDIAWMAGTWQAVIWGGVFEEFWTPPNGGTMLGVGRHLDNGKTHFIEFMSVEPSAEGLTMWMMVGSPSRGSQKIVPFFLADLTSHSAIFENKEHDFPSKISYTRLEEGKMQCVIEGAKSGESCREEFNFVRSST